MVFHDYSLERLTEGAGPVAVQTATQLSALPLKGGDEGIPTLSEVLSLVGGSVPLLIELKDQDGAMGPDVGPLEVAVTHALVDYEGPVALMSFNPHSVARMGQLCPAVPRGLVTASYDPDTWPLSADVCDHLREIPDYERVGACFISHEMADLTRPRVAALKAAGAQILCWTVRSPEQDAEARKIAQNVTFEGYLAAAPG